MAWISRRFILSLALLPIASHASRSQDTGIGLRDARTTGQKLQAIERAKGGAQDLISKGMTAEQEAIAKEDFYEPLKEAVGEKAGALAEKIGEKIGGNEDSAAGASHMADPVFQSYEDAVKASNAVDQSPVDANDDLGQMIAAKNCSFNPASCATSQPDPKPAPDAPPSSARPASGSKTFSLFCVSPDANYHAIMCAKNRRYRLYCVRGTPRPVAGAAGSFSMAIRAEEYACLDKQVLGLTGAWEQFPPHFMPYVGHNGVVDTLVGAAYSSPCRIIQTHQVACSGVGSFLGDLLGR